MLRRFLFLVVITSGLILGGTQGRCSPETGYLQSEVQGYYHTNIPTSHAICLLAKQSPVPIDVVIDDTNDPPVSISVEKATIAAILQKLLAGHPGHHPHEQSWGILVLPDWLLDKEVFPLTKKLTKFSVTCLLPNPTAAVKQPRPVYDFYLPTNPELNVSLPVIAFRQMPDHPIFPYLRSFANQSILEILTTISTEGGKSFLCYRMNNDFVKALNKEWAEKKTGPTWWPNPDAPCYSVIWGTGWYGVRGKE